LEKVMISSTDTRNMVTTLTYDALGNPHTSATGSHPAVTYTYDAIGYSTGPGSRAVAHCVSAEKFIVDRRFIGKERPLINQQTTTTGAVREADKSARYKGRDRKEADESASYKSSAWLCRFLGR
jgi:YD repeat-containing protein